MPGVGSTAYFTARTVTSLCRSLLNDAGVNAAMIGIASVSRIGNVVTVTTVGPHPFAAGDQVTIAGIADATYNGVFTILANLSTTQFTYNNNGANSVSTTGTAIGVNTGAVFTDSVLMPYANSAYRHVQRALVMAGSTTFVTDNSLFVVSAVNPVDASVQVTINDNTAPPNNLPYDLLYPLKLWERANLSTDDFVEMIDVTSMGGLPSRPQGAFLSLWAWEADGLKFLGATQDIQVRMRYAKAFADLVDGSSTVLIRNAMDAIAYEASAMAALARGSPMAEKWDTAGQDALEALVAASTRKQQYGNYRKRPFSARGGYPGSNRFM